MAKWYKFPEEFPFKSGDVLIMRKGKTKAVKPYIVVDNFRCRECDKNDSRIVEHDGNFFLKTVYDGESIISKTEDGKWLAFRCACSAKNILAIMYQEDLKDEYYKQIEYIEQDS